MSAFFEVSCACLVSFSMCTIFPMSLQLHEALVMGLDPTNRLHVMLELENPLINCFNADHKAVVDLFHS